MKRMSCLAIAVMIVLWCLAAPAGAKGPARKGRVVPSNPEGQPQVQMPTVTVTIDKKDLQTVTTSGGAGYALSDQTIIVGLDGKQLDIRKMPVPCRVKLTYATEGGMRQALRIDLQSVSADATTHWTSKVPD